MDVLVVKNAPDEGPGNLIPFFKLRGLEYKIVEAYEGQNMDIPHGCKFLVVLGGPMGVYEMKGYPFLKAVASIIEKALRIEIKVLGICLGAQLLAHVLGSKVYPGKTFEAGWCEIVLTEGGKKDPGFKHFRDKRDICRVFQWHGDTFDMPEDSILLASSNEFPHQAFKFMDSYGLQFHPEVTPALIELWSKDREDLKELEAETAAFYTHYLYKALSFYDSFFVNHSK